MMTMKPLSETELGLPDPSNPGWAGKAPLWFYILRESEIRQGGRRLGPLGAKLVAESHRRHPRLRQILLHLRQDPVPAGTTNRPERQIHYGGVRGLRPGHLDHGARGAALNPGDATACSATFKRGLKPGRRRDWLGLSNRV